MPFEANIVSTGTALPGDPIDNEAIARRFGTSAEWIELFVGTRQRHLAASLDSGERTHTLADLCTHAAEQALSRSGLDSTELDFIVLATSSPDELMPATVNRIATQLQIDQVATYQLQSGCSGAVQALDLARRLLDEQHRFGLVLGADVCVKHLDLEKNKLDVTASELVNYVLFGDGAGAAVVASQDTAGFAAIRGVVNRFTGLHRAPAQIVRWFGAGDIARHAGLGELPFEEDYKAIEKLVPPLSEEALNEMLSTAGWDASSMSYLLPPQLSGRMTAQIGKLLNLGDAAEVSCVADTGNTGNAMPFLQLDLLHNRIGPGDRAVGIAIESSKWIKSAFAIEGR